MVIKNVDGNIKRRIAKAIIIGVISSVPLYHLEAQDMPTGGNVQSGSATISGQGTNHMIINQSTNKSIIKWDSFSIHSGGRVDFQQPSSDSFSLNRVNGSTPSTIAGQLNSNGKVMLVNPNGVAITPNGVVSTGSFTASTLNIKNDDFLQRTMYVTMYVPMHIYIEDRLAWPCTIHVTKPEANIDIGQVQAISHVSANGLHTKWFVER